MAKTYEINLDTFSGGMSDDPRIPDSTQGELIKQFDIFSKPKRLVPVRSLVADTHDGSTSTGMKQYNIRTFGIMNGVNAVYGLGTKSDGTGFKFFKKTGPTSSSWAAISGAEGTDTVWPGVLQPGVGSDQSLYFFAGDKMRALVYAGGTEYVSTSKDFSDTTTSVSEGVVAKDQNTYIGRNNGIYRITAPGTAATFTVTIASPGVFTQVAHGLAVGSRVRFTTTGALPTGLAVGTEYYVISAGLTADAFEVSATSGGSAINTSGSQSGVHTLIKAPNASLQLSIPTTHEVSSMDNYGNLLAFSASPIVSAVARATLNPGTAADSSAVGTKTWTLPSNILASDDSYATAAGTAAPLSYWKFDESSGNAADSAGSNTLTNNNGITYAAGKLNNAADLEDGSTNYFSITDAAQTGLDLSTSFSISMWVKPESQPASNNSKILMSKYLRAGNQRAYTFVYEDLAGTKRLTLLVSADGATATTLAVNQTLSNATWYHVLVTYDLAAGTATFYVNGSQVGSAQTGGPTSIKNSTAKFEIGANDGDEGATGCWDGMIDEVGIWTSVLSTADISSLYNAGTPLAYSSIGTGTTHYLKATNFGFTIPVGATINGIEVNIEKKAVGTVTDSAVKIVKADGSIGTTNKALGTNWSASDTSTTYGSSSDLWGETWAYTDINDTDFGVVLSATMGSGTAAYVDNITITVSYTLAPASYPNLSSYLYTWDLVSADVLEAVDMGPGKLKIIANLGGIILGVTDEYLSDTFGNDKGRLLIRAWGGGEASIMKEIPALAAGGVLEKWKQTRGGRLYFYAKIPIDLTGSTYNQGIWAFGRKDSGSPWAIAIENDSGQFSSGSVQGFRYIGNFLFVGHSTDGSISRTADDETYAYTSIYQSQIYDNNYENQLKSTELTTEPLPSGASAVVKIRQDEETNWTTGFTMNTANDTYALRNRLASAEEFAKFHECQFRLESTGGAVISKLRARYWKLNDETEDE